MLERVRHEDLISGLAADNDGVAQLALARLTFLDVIGADPRGRRADARHRDAPRPA